MPDFKHAMAFSELISNLAFLRTIPAPVFNSEINLSFMGSLINIRENSFNELPHKNQNSIKILYDLFDFNSILKCVKGLIFDYSIIIFGNENSQSLLFQVIEGIKQLAFPFTFDFAQFIPGNSVYAAEDGQTMKDLFEDLDEMQPCIFAIEFDHETYNQYKIRENTVIIDIDSATVIVNGQANTDDDENQSQSS